MNSYVLCGMQYGDEGKGSFVDYLVFRENVDCVIRYNGGSQASHTVITPEGILHKFSQLGSGMFNPKCHTYLTSNMVINLDNLLVELEVFEEKVHQPISELIKRVHIHEDCYIVTPYHKLINKLRELAKGEDRRGSVGTGVSEVTNLLPIGVQVKDVFNDNFCEYIEKTESHLYKSLKALQDYAIDFYNENKSIIIANAPKDILSKLEIEINYLLREDSYMDVGDIYILKHRYAPDEINLKKCIYKTYETSFRKTCSSAIYEGSQGLLIDRNYGIKPNTTYLDTTNKYALDISYYNDNVTKIGIAKAFCTRHGAGVFPTESKEVASKISDINQEETFWNGMVRFGWFDAVLFKYAQKINKVDKVYLSSLDKLDSFDTILVCEGYIYDGPIDEEFRRLFDFYYCGHDKVIYDIKHQSNKLKYYLEKVTPKYRAFNGWKKDISNCKRSEQLPSECLEYIDYLQLYAGADITVVSVGPTRDNKILL